jgi:transketolase N-terminal domain/subunit
MTMARRAPEVVDQFAGGLVVERGADGDLQDDGVAVESGAVGAHAVLAALALVLGVIAEVDQRVVALRADHDDIAAAAAVAARWTAAGHELFAPEGHAAVAAVAGLDANFCFIDEHGKPGIRVS